MMQRLLEFVEDKFASNYASSLGLLHMKSIAGYYQVVKVSESGLFEATLCFTDTVLDDIAGGLDAGEGGVELSRAVEIILTPALEHLADILNPQLITVRTMEYESVENGGNCY